MNLSDEARARIIVEVSTDADPTGSTVEVKVDGTWYAAAWLLTPTSSNGVYVQRARTTGYFAGPSYPTPGGAVVLALGRHPVEVRVTWPSADAVADFAGHVDVA